MPLPTPVPDPFDGADLTVRPLRVEDVPAAERLSDEAFLQVDRATYRAGDPPPEGRTAAGRESWTIRARHLVTTDPDGCWAVDLEGELVAFATSFVREKMWLLATYAVSPALQGRGLGKVLLERAMASGRGCLRAMLAASDDPRAIRRYLVAGFDLHPQMRLTGVVDRSAIPAEDLRHVRDAVPADRDLMDSVDRRTRGAAHGSDHEVMGRLFRGLVLESSSGQGYVYVTPGGSPVLLAASDRRTASRLMWAALATAPSGGWVEAAHLTAANQWALRVGRDAGLALDTAGYLAVSGMRPPSPYLHHGTML